MSDLALDPTNMYSRAMPTQNEEVRKLASLLEMSQSLSGAHKLKDSLHRVLELLERHHNVVRGVVLLADVADGTLRVEAAIEAGRTTPKSRAKFDAAIVERVVGSNKPVVVPDRDDANADPELIRYSWSGTRGDPLLRQYNQATLATVAENVAAFNISYFTNSGTYEYLDVQLQIGTDARASVETAIPLLNGP